MINGKVKDYPAKIKNQCFYGVISQRRKKKWALLESNQPPIDYESIALTE